MVVVFPFKNNSFRCFCSETLWQMLRFWVKLGYFYLEMLIYGFHVMGDGAWWEGAHSKNIRGPLAKGSRSFGNGKWSANFLKFTSRPFCPFSPRSGHVLDWPATIYDIFSSVLATPSVSWITCKHRSGLYLATVISRCTENFFQSDGWMLVQHSTSRHEWESISSVTLPHGSQTTGWGRILSVCDTTSSWTLRSRRTEVASCVQILLVAQIFRMSSSQATTHMSPR